jgi:hypothetical protein
MNFRERAQNYVPPPKIADIARIPIETEIYDDGEGVSPETNKGYTFSYMIINDKEVRVPESVISQLHDQMLANPNMVAFRVVKKGEGIMTKYTVIPIMN